MRFYWVAFTAILCSVGVILASGETAENGASTDEVYSVMPLDPVHLITEVGQRHSVIIEQYLFGSAECYLKTLDGKLIHMNEDFDYPGFEIITGSQVDCGLNVTVAEGMAGNWAMLARSTIFNMTTERRLTFSISIKGQHESEEEDADDVEEIDNTVWLAQIHRVARSGQYIDITLNKLEHSETCYYIAPSGVVNEGNDNPGVKVQGSSNFVSCRITIGPMEASLLGDWVLCGKYVTDDIHERCQPVNISWNNNNNPNTTWQTSEQTLFNHSVSFGGYLRPVVVGSGTTLNCHVITPHGEDLVINSGLEYPFIQRLAVNSSSTCAVSIGPLEESLLGSWTIYGQFTSVIWFNEVRMPLNVFLYDEENPYDQPYNVTNLTPFNRVINLNTITIAEVTGSGNIDSCQYRAPNGRLYDFDASNQFPGVTVVDVGNSIVCRITVGPIDVNMLGEWQIIGKFSNNGVFTERRQKFNIIQEDPENPILEERIIENVADLFFNTKIGATQSITIDRNVFINAESCHIRTPSGRQYTIMDGFNVPGVTVLNGSNIECGVSIDVFSEDMVGEWILIARATLSSDAIERRRRFVVYVEEQVEAFPRELVITEGNDLYIRLRNPTDQYETCNLVAPREDSNTNHDIDAIHNESCGFVVKTVEKSDEGTWEIVYGAKIVYRATVNVTVNDRELSGIENLTLNKDRRVSQTIGPKEAVYCKLEDPNGITVFDSFGRCTLYIERVTIDHNGQWKMFVGLPGRVLIEEHTFTVTVNEPEPKALVTTKVEKQRPSVVLSCSVSSAHNVRACMFRDPRGNILIATQGVGEDRFVFYGSDVSFESEVHSHECGIRITNPTVEDLGLWRCAIETEDDTHYGFLSVVCPWMMQDPDVQASVITEPNLTTDRTEISAIEGEGVTMSCSIQAPIRYCYFRASNGTVFSVKPATSSASMQYVGNGFDAGECGVRFNDLMSIDSGRWSCHVGTLVYNDIEEQRVHFQINVQEPMTVRHYVHEVLGLVAEARVNSERMLDYCRFVRIDGLGFTTDNIPEGYRFLGSLDSGHCLLKIEEASMLNLHPWTIAVQVRGQDEELSRQTVENLLWIQPPKGRRSLSLYIWIIVIMVGLSLMMVGISLGPEKNRKWTFARASQLRNSLRNSFRKPKPIENAYE